MSMWRGWLALLAAWVAAVALVGPVLPAAAYWSVTGSATGTAVTGTLNAPTDVTAVQSDPGVAAARVSWSLPAEPSITPTGYQVERFEGGTVVTACGTTRSNPIEVTTCVDTGLLPGHTYAWVVTALYRSWTATSATTVPLTISDNATLAVTSVDPVVGPVTGGTRITVTGAGFLPGALVKLDGRTAPEATLVDPNTITAVTPRGREGVVDVTVTNPDKTTATLTGAFTYQVPPSVRRVNPQEGPTAGGSLVTISGAGYTPGASVLFGETPAAQVTFVDARTITAVSPAHETGIVAITVTTTTGSGTLPDAFTYRAAGLAVTRVDPPVGPVTGGTRITVTGSGFGPGAIVKLDGRPAPEVTVVDANTITALTPRGKEGVVDVTVTNPDKTTATLTSAFTYMRETARTKAPTTAPAGPASPLPDPPASVSEPASVADAPDS